MNRSRCQVDRAICARTGSKVVNRFKAPSEPVHQKSFLVCETGCSPSEDFECEIVVPVNSNMNSLVLVELGTHSQILLLDLMASMPP